MQPVASDLGNLFENLGRSEQPFVELVDAFYAGVEAAPQLRTLYPEELTEARHHLVWFLVQRFGGPQQFTQNRGAPMLRRRHVQFAITPDVAKTWFDVMSAAVDSVAAFEPYKGALLEYFEDAAVFLINRQAPLDAEVVMPVISGQ